jgi:hypothetical protein
VALLDISLVTVALKKLLEAHIANSPAWSFGQPTVTAQPPDLLDPGTLGVYLYHLSEEAHLKSQPPVGQGSPPVRFTPMGLSLYYQICARGSGTGDAPTLQEQTYLGCALKALHDYAMVDDDTRVPRKSPQPPLKLFEEAGIDRAGNRLRIVLQPLTFSEVATFWGSGERVPRLALYYQVSVVLLEPDRPTSVAGRVLQVGVQSFANLAPRLSTSESRFTATFPGRPAIELVARPAQVAVGGSVVFAGSDLVGDATELVLRNRRWADPIVADWALESTPERVTATVGPTASGNLVVPGIYSAQVRVTRRRRLPDGTERDFSQSSNETPFAITPRIDAVTRSGATWTITGHVLWRPGFADDDIMVYVGEHRLELTSAAVAAAGEFRVKSATELELVLPAATPPGVPIPLRVFVLGAESAPRWVTP